MSRARRPSTTHLPAFVDPPRSLLEALVRRFPGVAAETWASRLERGLVTDLEGRPFAPDAAYAPRMAVRYFREVEAEPAPTGTIEVLHLCDRLVVVDKPPAVPVTPTGPWVRRSLLERVERELGLEGLAPAHRLDRETAGVLLFVRRREERGAYAGLFAARRVERVYEALAALPARPPEDSWRLESRIVAGEPFFRMREVPGPPNALTELRLVDWRAGVGRFELRPGSGKKHQLRLHLASLGWPILGDRLYPDLLPSGGDGQAPPLALVARRLAFCDPFTGVERAFGSRRTLPWPAARGEERIEA